MCGITGFFLNQADSKHIAHRFKLGGLLTHRGPDYFDGWVNSEQTVGLQHYRLAIIELSSAGSQPMRSANRRWTIVFNGEIYNHKDLRKQLELEGTAPSWRGYSDTETLLAGISAWGIQKTLDACVGMFAIALYDCAENTLVLARDRMGEKPLYYGYLSGALCLASEPKALRSVAGGRLELDVRSVAAYMRLGYVPGSQSIYKGILRLPPGSLITFTKQDIENGNMPMPVQYWSLPSIVRNSAGVASELTTLETVDKLDKVMRNAVHRQMMADVPIGALLSGGIDSSLIVSLMQAQSSSRVHTFSIGFENSRFDEAPHARRIASHLGTLHTDLYISAHDALNLIPSLPEIFGEPFADSSQIPTLLVSQMAKHQVTVALTGDGGDELFAGYERYFRVARGYSLIQRIPLSLRNIFSKILKDTPHEIINMIIRLLGNPGSLHNPLDRILKIAEILSSKNPSILHRQLITLWDPSEIMFDVNETQTAFSEELPPAPTLIEQMMLADALCYLPDNLLVKVDRSAMTYSLECRSPFLDHNVVEFAWSLSFEQKAKTREGKWILKKLLERYVPQKLFDRPKQGFGIPLGDWLRGPLQDWAVDMIWYCNSKQGFGIFDLKKIDLIFDEHMSGLRNWEHKLWTFLMFVAWMKANEN